MSGLVSDNMIIYKMEKHWNKNLLDTMKMVLLQTILHQLIMKKNLFNI